LGLRV